MMKRTETGRRIFRILIVLVLSFALCACTGGSSSSSLTAEDGRRVLRVGMECAYAPNNWMEEKKSDTNVVIENVPGMYAEGYDVQIARLIGEQLDADIVVVRLDWEDLIDSLNAGEIDLIIAGMADTEERRELISFSDCYSAQKTEYGILLYKDSKYASAESLDDLAGAALMGQKGTRYDEVIDQIDGAVHLSPVSSVVNMVDRLLNKTCDGIVADELLSAAYLTKYALQLTFVTFEDGKGFDIGFEGSCAGIRKEDTELLEQVNRALAEISMETRKELENQAIADMP